MKSLTALLVLTACLGCGSPAEPEPAVTATPAPQFGAQTHQGHGQINPNAQMPAAGSKTK